MRIDNLVIKNYLRKKRESVIIDLIIRDYNKSNFYIALVFNSRIEKFKVLYIPLEKFALNKKYAGISFTSSM